MSGIYLNPAILVVMVIVLGVLGLALGILALNRHVALKRIEEAERSFRDLYNNISEGVFRTTLDGHMISANPALVRLNGYDSEDEMLNDVNDIAGRWYVDPGRREEIHQTVRERGQVIGVVSEVYRYKTRERIWIEESTRLVCDRRSGAARYFEGTVREVTDTIRRLQLHERYDKLAAIIPGCLYQQRRHFDGTMSMPYASAGLFTLFGVRPEEVVENAALLGELVHPDDRRGLRESFERSAARLSPRECEYRIYSRDGVEKWVLGQSVPEREVDGSILWHGFLADITERKRAEARIFDLAYRDTLTGLPNRMALVEGLRKAVADAGHDRGWNALLFVDLDQFKALNDTKGHHLGDQLLTCVAQRLKPLIGDGDLVARLGGDEFVILLQNLGTRPQAAELHARRVAGLLQTSIADPFVLDGFPFRTTASIGVALFRGNDLAVEELLKRADMAMYEAKAAGRGSVAFFRPEMQDSLEERTALTSAFRDALEAGELELNYQPQVNEGGACFGVEALLRWNHAERGAIAPGVFIRLAASAGLSSQVDAFVLATACRTLRRWRDMPALASLEMAVNIGGQPLGKALVGLVTDAINASGADASRLTIELTEHVMLDNLDEVDAALTALKGLGVKIALDDFGTGYSSLSHLKRLPIDALKIDRSFVDDLETDPNDRVIVQTILNIARNLGVAAIAEGVENEMQLLLLRRFGCRAFQGFFYGRPMALDEFEQRLGGGERPRLAVLPPSRLVV